MKKTLIALLLYKIYTLFFKPKKMQQHFEEVINTSAEHTRLQIPEHIKKTVYDLLNTKDEQQPGYNSPLHLILNHQDSKVNLQTAQWLAAQQQKDVYRVNLSCMASKYIGETEKNLDRIFYKAENNNFVLLFEEADALFGKRTDVKDAHDKYANLEIAYFKKSIRAFKGTVLFNCITQEYRQWQLSDFVKTVE